MNIKLKLRLGVGLLFVFIILLFGLGAYNITALNHDTQNILVANYNTLDYSRQMIMALDEDMSESETQNVFAKNLLSQQQNITEPGEKEWTDKLAMDFDQIKKYPHELNIASEIRKDLTEIMLLNMNAIQFKSNVAKKTASVAIWWISIVGAFCFIIAFSLLINLPSNIANPIRELTDSIQQIADRNYSERVNFEQHSEFGQLATAFNIMAAKLEEYKNSTLSRLMFEKKRFEILVNKMHDALIGLNEQNEILFVNEAAIKILNMADYELIGNKAQDIALKNDLMRSLIQDIIYPAKSKTNIQTLKIFADSKESYFEKEFIRINVTPTGEKEAKPEGYFILLRNITSYKELDFAKTNFIATISHELKTPISSIKASVHILQNPATGNLNADQKQLIDSINDDGMRLLKITSELLHLSQAETGNIQLSILPCSPLLIVQYALDAVNFMAEHKGVSICVVNSSNNIQVLADAEKTTWVLINFLTNAIRYSPREGAVHIDTKLESDNFVRFSVSDNGPGIDTKYISKLFTRYFQIPGGNKSGTGLGLAISKEFIEAQAGIIGVESLLGKGSTFYFSLPILPTTA